MSIEVKVPVLPESVSDATVATWHKKPGDAVKRDDNLVDLETDKVVLEVPAPQDGVLGEIKAEAGTTVTAEEVLATLEEAAAEASEEDQPKDPPSPDESQETSSEKGDNEADARDDSQQSKKEKPKGEPSASSDELDDSERELSPAVRRMVEEHKIDPSRINASGRGGRITKADVVDYLESGDGEESGKSTDTGKGKQSEKPKDKSVRAPQPSRGSRAEERVPMSRLRAKIAERLVESQRTAAILTSFNEVDLQAVMDLRSQYKQEFEDQHGVRLGLMSFFVRAAVHALQKHPIVNASVDDGDIVYHGYQDIGIAVSTEKGLLVPVLRDVQNMSLAEAESAIREYADQARNNKIKLEDLQGGTFTITNGGVFGSLISTPIVNPPQSAILGMHAIKDRPMAVDGQVQIRPMMYIALSYDHRIIDGKDAVLFLVALKEALEDPARMLLDL